MNLSSRVGATLSAVALAAVIGAVVLASPSDDEPTSGASTEAVESSAVSSPADGESPTTLGPTTAPDVDVPASADATSTSTTTSTSTIEPAVDLPNRGVHAPLRDIDGWLQSDVTSLEELRGQVVAVQFWTFGCSNCKATLPHMQELYAEYHDAGLEIVGVHSPEFDYEADVDNIIAAAAELGVTWPIALDPTKHTFHDWQDGPRGFWPRLYLLDRDGNVRYDHRGEGRYDEIDEAVRVLLAEPST